MKGIKSFNENYVRKNNTQSECIAVGEDLKQGEVLSPTLIIIIMDDVMKELKTQS